MLLTRGGLALTAELLSEIALSRLPEPAKRILPKAATVLAALSRLTTLLALAHLTLLALAHLTLLALPLLTLLAALRPECAVKELALTAHNVAQPL